MVDVNLTNAERFILANQFEILARLEPEQNGDPSSYYMKWAESLFEGHKWLYDQLFDRLYEDMPKDKAEFVIDILDLYSAMKNSFANLANTTNIDEKGLRFPGFDGNNEGDLYGFAIDLAKHGRFTEFLSVDGNNSHMRTTETYERMLAKWNEFGKTFNLTREQIIDILYERIHPTRRKDNPKPT